MDEETKEKEKENSPQPSEEQNQGEPSQEVKPETPDYKAELVEAEKRILEKVEKAIGAQGYQLREDLRKVAKGEYVDEEEGKQGLSEEQIRGIVAGVVKEETGKIGEQLNQQVTELTKAFASSQSKSQGGGEGGGKPPKEEGTPRPKLNEAEEEAVAGMEWDSKKAGWWDKSTKPPMFYPLKRILTAPPPSE